MPKLALTPYPLLWVSLGEKGNMSGDEWERALAAAKRLDYTSERDAQPNMQLIPSQPSFVRRLMSRLLRRSLADLITQANNRSLEMRSQICHS